MVILIAVYYLFAGSVPLNEVNSTVDKTNVFWGIVRGLMYGGLALQWALVQLLQLRRRF